mmetsp:Transcript_38683/g.53989  ORF Transcript_38683/g.53989 Transcript_38683/m.53989 type:complete len:213 (+) Transcript_38683:216-854(+)
MLPLDIGVLSSSASSKSSSSLYASSPDSAASSAQVAACKGKPHTPFPGLGEDNGDGEAEALAFVWAVGASAALPVPAGATNSAVCAGSVGGKEDGDDGSSSSSTTSGTSSSTVVASAGEQGSSQASGIAASCGSFCNGDRGKAGFWTFSCCPLAAARNSCFAGASRRAAGCSSRPLDRSAGRAETDVRWAAVPLLGTEAGARRPGGALRSRV